MTTEFILSHGEKFIQCPYNTAHQITNARLLTHLEKCRKAYFKDLSEEDRRRRLGVCRHNARHHIPKLELEIHESMCADAMAIVRHLAFHNSEEGDKRYEETRKRDSDGHRHSSSRHRSDDSRSHRSHGHSSSSSRRHSSSGSHHSSRSPGPSSSSTKPAGEKKINAWGLEEEDWDAECTGDGPGYIPEEKLKKEVVVYNPSGLTKSERKKYRNEFRKAQEMMQKGEAVELPTANTIRDIKPDLKDLKIKQEKEDGRNSPLEPGEIDEEDDKSAVKPPPDVKVNGQNDSRVYIAPTRSLASSSSGRNQPSDVSELEETDSTDSDSDDFAGYDPYDDDE